MEWVSNVTIGSDGEAEGFAFAADRVVSEYLTAYLTSRPEIGAKLDEGSVAFWLQGYSRGGAVANLVAKRLIDRYQATGNEVYAYCIEAPSGGVVDLELPDRDYRSIHNVINPNDPVPYLAPTSMGFVRYGVDHYLFSGKADSENLIRDDAGRPTSDNLRRETIPKGRIALMEKHLADLFGENEDLGYYLPYLISFQKLNLLTLQSYAVKAYTTTASFLDSFFNTLISSDPESQASGREVYASGEIQAAARRLMLFANSDSDLYALMNEAALFETVFVSANAAYEELKQYVTFVSGKMTLGFRNPTADSITEATLQTLRENERLLSLCATYPEGGAETAIRDLGTVLRTVLYGTRDVDDLMTMSYNLGNLLRNHEYVQQLVILMTYDSWFEITVED